MEDYCSKRTPESDVPTNSMRGMYILNLLPPKKNQVPARKI